MQEIALTQGQLALVDDAVYDYLMQWTWHAWYSPSTRSYYARRGTNTIYMQRAVLEYYGHDLTGLVVDHKNHKTLDNQLSNLLACTDRENAQNKSNNKSGYAGVYFDKHSNKYRAYVRVNGVLKGFGRHSTAKEAYEERTIYINMRRIK
jgi:HNH endonuclease